MDISERERNQLHNGAFATPLCRNIAGAVKDEMSIDHLLAILFKFPAKPTRTQYPFSNLRKQLFPAL